MARVTRDGFGMKYELSGSGPPVLLLHGLGSCASDWRLQMRALAVRYTVVVVDLRGHGESDKPKGPYTMSILRADVAHLLETLSMGPAHIVGISLGGMIAFQLAVDKPDLVRTLTVINSAPQYIPSSLATWLSLNARFWTLRLFGIAPLAKRIAAVNFPEPGQEPMRAAFESRLLANDVSAYRATLQAFAGWSVEDHIGTIRCPTLVVSGDQDYTSVAFKQAYASKIPHARVAVVEHSRHMTPLDQPEALNGLILTFLDHEAPALPGGGAAQSRHNHWRDHDLAGSA